MDAIYQKTLSATEFKAKCLDLMDQLASGQLKRVIVTKRGKVVASLVPPESAAPTPVDADVFWGCMKDVTNIPDGFDLTQPLYADAELDEFEANLDIMARKMLARPHAK
jgi:antitoxin (DNA-binding transcriptional repressor) of toxin-antitoxin stability system